jgi:hypothetical protein
VNAKPHSYTHPRPRSKFAHSEIETMRRRRVEHFRILAAIAERFPKDADAKGRASGAVSVGELAEGAGVGRKAVGRALKYWQQWRVLWVHWRREQIRFERTVVENLLATWASDPRSTAKFLREHRAKREAAAPRPSVPKTLRGEVSQVAETTLEENVS